MSDPKTPEPEAKENENTPNDPVDPPKETTPPEPKTVDLEVHKRTSQDMMKYKTERNALQQKLNALETADQARKVADAQEKEDWKKVAELHAKDLQKLQNEKASLHSSMIDSHKKSAVIEGVGGFTNPKYADMAINLNNISMNDGTIDPESLKLEVDRIKRDHRVLLKSSPSSNLPNNASNPDGSLFPLRLFDNITVGQLPWTCYDPAPGNTPVGHLPDSHGRKIRK